MRTTAVLLLALTLALLAPTGAAQPPDFTQAYQVRAAVGDIPTTTAREADGSWNVEQRLRVQFDNASDEAARTWHFTLPAGSTLVNATCDCARSTHSESAGTSTFTILPQTASGPRTITLLTRQPVAGDVFGGSVAAPLEAGPERVVVLYAPTGSDISSNADFNEVGTAPSDPGKTIHYAQFDGDDPMPADLWFAIHPATTGVAPVDGDDDGGSMITAWLVPILLGLVLGVVLWAALVSKGLVQAKSRKQVASTAAHVEAAAQDPPAVLEGKKRALLAALKEVELAKQANEMPVEVYDVVKADLKKQAVTVMRALESGTETKP